LPSNGSQPGLQDTPAGKRPSMANRHASDAGPCWRFGLVRVPGVPRFPTCRGFRRALRHGPGTGRRAAPLAVRPADPGAATPPATQPLAEGAGIWYGLEVW
jgi:hypothetical protein